MRVARTSLLLAAVAFGAGCADNPQDPGTPSGSSRVLITDDPFPYHRVERVDLYIVSVSASLSPDTGAGAAGGGFVTIATPRRRVNMLALQNGVTEQLGTADLPPGAVTAVRMVIDTDSSSITLRDGRVLTSTSTPGIAWQSSAGRPTLNALINQQILVPDTGATIVIIYDVGQAFIPPQVIDPSSTDSGFIFSPVLAAADANRTGAITGVVRADSIGGLPVADASLQLYIGNPATPENTWPRLGTAMSAADGSFTFAYVTTSAYWATTAWAGATYIITADPPPGSGLTRAVVPNHTVIAQQETSAGVIVLP